MHAPAFVGQIGDSLHEKQFNLFHPAESSRLGILRTLFASVVDRSHSSETGTGLNRENIILAAGCADRRARGCVSAVICQTFNMKEEMDPTPDARTGLSDPEQWVALHGDYLFKYALIRLRDPAKAEDAVQETFLAALKGGKNFGGRSAEKSWLVGILKNKIFDYYRKACRERSFSDMEFYSDAEGDCFEPEGLHKDGWIHELGPLDWSGPGASLDSEVFWKTFHDCCSKLPKNVATVFNLREVDGVESREICRLLNITESNLWVMLHRARMALRRCLETNWFGKSEHAA
jgi:RNA polymerase sigma-70 factor (ECF subfamily)